MVSANNTVKSKNSSFKTYFSDKGNVCCVYVADGLNWASNFFKDANKNGVAALQTSVPLKFTHEE